MKNGSGPTFNNQNYLYIIQREMSIFTFQVKPLAVIFIYLSEMG